MIAIKPLLTVKMGRFVPDVRQKNYCNAYRVTIKITIAFTVQILQNRP